MNNGSVGRAIDAARGTVVFGSGINALVGDIAHTEEDDYIMVSGHISGSRDTEPKEYLVPLTSICYIAFSDE